MRSRPSVLLALLALLAFAGLALGAWALLGRTAPKQPAPVEPALPIRNEAPVQAPTAPLENQQLAPSAPVAAGVPIEVDLELVLADPASAGKGGTPLGSAATARLRGSVVSGIGAPVGAEVTFEAGPNQGRVLHCDATGRFGATNLYPGKALLRVRGPGIPGSRRVVLLRQKAEAELNLAFGRLSEITGEVLMRDGLPIAGAKVDFDGQEATTDEKGVFHFDGVAPGLALVVVEHPGYAGVQEELAVPAAKKIEKGQLKYVLEKGGRLTLKLPDPISATDQAYCFILQDTAAGTQRKFPWFRVNPVRIWPGNQQVVEDLPAGSFTLHLFCAGAMAKPASKGARLDAGGEAEVTLNLEPAPTIGGIVRLNGEPVQRAEVSLEASDRLMATLAAFGASNEFFVESEILPDAPPAVQRVLTDGAGRYDLSSWEGVCRERYLIARYDGGKQIAMKLLKGGEKEVDLDLKPSGGGDGMLRLVLGERERDLPVRITVNGEPREVITLPRGQDLRVDSLNRGRWKLTVRYNGNALENGKELEIGAETSLPLELPR